MKNPLHNFFLVNTAAWIQKGDKFLLAQRALRDNYRPGERSIPGGKLEWSLDEKSLEKNIQREIKEEIGIEVESDMVFLDNYNFQARTIYALNIIFLCQRKSGDAQALEDTEAIKWMTLDELVKDTSLSEWLQKDMECLKKYFSDKKG